MCEQVRWAPDTEEGNLTFYSVSIDGKINHWVLNQNELGLTTVMTLFLDRPPIPGPDGTLITLKGNQGPRRRRRRYVANSKAKNSKAFFSFSLILQQRMRHLFGFSSKRQRHISRWHRRRNHLQMQHGL